MNNKQRLRILKKLRNYLFVEKVENKCGKYERIVAKELCPFSLLRDGDKDYEEIKAWLEDEKEDEKERCK